MLFPSQKAHETYAEVNRAYDLVKVIDNFALILERQDGYAVLVMDESADVEAAEQILSEHNFDVTRLLPTVRA